jgi:hypothetical protein
VIERPDEPGAVLDCATPPGRRLSRSAGTATVVPEPVVGGRPRWRPQPEFETGGSASQVLRLSPGTWELSLQYHSPVDLRIEARGLRGELPASLDGMFGFAPGQGHFWPAGRVEVGDTGPLRVTVSQAELPWPARALGVDRRTWLGAIAATPPGSARDVPFADACRRYVDRYTLEPRE